MEGNCTLWWMPNQGRDLEWAALFGQGHDGKPSSQPLFMTKSDADRDRFLRTCGFGAFLPC